mgnify:CR=1 FL=1
MCDQTESEHGTRSGIYKTCAGNGINPDEDAAVCSVADVEQWKDKIDVLILCGGSATDLPKQTPEFAKLFNVIDSFDTHARIPEHFANVDAAAKESGKVGIISVGWDPVCSL